MNENSPRSCNKRTWDALSNFLFLPAIFSKTSFPFSLTRFGNGFHSSLNLFQWSKPSFSLFSLSNYSLFSLSRKCPVFSACSPSQAPEHPKKYLSATSLEITSRQLSPQTQSSLKKISSPGNPLKACSRPYSPKISLTACSQTPSSSPGTSPNCQPLLPQSSLLLSRILPPKTIKQKLSSSKDFCHLPLLGRYLHYLFAPTTISPEKATPAAPPFSLSKSCTL